jgi:hypothetical protein
MDERMARQAKLATDIVSHVDALAPLLAEFKCLGLENGAAGWSVAQACFAGKPEAA